LRAQPKGEIEVQKHLLVICCFGVLSSQLNGPSFSNKISGLISVGPPSKQHYNNADLWNFYLTYGWLSRLIAPTNAVATLTIHGMSINDPAMMADRGQKISTQIRS